ncbi:hypothetical protein PCL_05321 [Purpureocillium lilacinum]|uniref:Uncharacterized protein n=1 Tax=Purpureocillium lilacinum TaxID=33203 RepID=A0A2U3DV26_PURLI|nr:hypothetical protein PCL_05321 [Purpureocillium lilacinum]
MSSVARELLVSFVEEAQWQFAESPNLCPHHLHQHAIIAPPIAGINCAPGAPLHERGRDALQPHGPPNGGTGKRTACTHPPRPNSSARQRAVLPRIDATKSALGVRSRRPTVARPRPATLRLTSEHQTNSFTVAKIVHFHHGGFYSSVSQSDQPQTPLGPARKLQRHTLTLSACLLQHSPPRPPRCRLHHRLAPGPRLETRPHGVSLKLLPSASRKSA